MINTQQDKQIFNDSSPLKKIMKIEQSLMIMRRKLSQMNKRENQNVQQLEKVFYSSIPMLKTKLTQSLQQQKFQQRKKLTFHESVQKLKSEQNKQQRLINQKQIERNKQMLSMFKISQCNAVKQMSKKNQLYIQRMRSYRIEQNRQKRQLVKSRLQNSRSRVNDFRISKMQYIKQQKEQDLMAIEKKKQTMLLQMNKLIDKQNLITENVDKSEELLRQLRFAIDKMHKMSQSDFIRVRNQITSVEPNLPDEKIFEKILVTIIQEEKQKKSPNKLSMSLYQTRAKYASTGQLKKFT